MEVKVEVEVAVVEEDEEEVVVVAAAAAALRARWHALIELPRCNQPVCRLTGL